MRKRNPESGFIELLFEPWALAVIGVILVIAALAYPFLSHVGRGEIVVKDCDGELTVWSAPRDEGFRWDGLCRTTTYHLVTRSSFKEPIEVDGVRVIVRGRLVAVLPDGDDMKALHKTYGSEEALLEKAVMPAALEDILAAAADPAWHRPQGGRIKRELKGALEYGLRRISPTGAIWSTHEAKHLLETDIRVRLHARTFPHGVKVDALLGFVTER